MPLAQWYCLVLRCLGRCAVFGSRPYVFNNLRFFLTWKAIKWSGGAELVPVRMILLLNWWFKQFEAVLMEIGLGGWTEPEIRPVDSPTSWTGWSSPVFKTMNYGRNNNRDNEVSVSLVLVVSLFNSLRNRTWKMSRWPNGYWHNTRPHTTAIQLIQLNDNNPHKLIKYTNDGNSMVWNQRLPRGLCGKLEVKLNYV